LALKASHLRWLYVD